ncbi:MAG: alpha/beta hydrolase, partial [Porticoccaceae bacterium]|nr:alpha/beta hydrolase [Porticoccaceae bacterium]
PQGNLYYAEAGDASQATLVLIHGTPGSWRDMSALLVEPQLRNQFRVISIDRPGWGSSTVAEGQPFVAFSYQAGQIAKLLEQLRQENPSQTIVLAGHSLGASIAPRVAADYPHLVDGLLLLSGTHSAELGKPRRHHRVGQWSLVKPLIGGALRKANREMLVLDQQLAQMDERWGEITVPVTVIQGGRDGLVSHKNTGFIRRVQAHNPNLKVVRLEKAGHFTHLQQQPLIVTSALEMLKIIRFGSLQQVPE